MNLISRDEDILCHLRERQPILDVRAPTEFLAGHLPGSFNLPLLDDGQRAAVGTTYKQVGAEAAVKLGYELISGDVHKSRVESWSKFIRQNPTTAIMCFRGGQRSQLVQEELLRSGFDVPLIDGGFKRVRRLLFSQLDDASEKLPWRVLSGFTGAGKTQVLRAHPEFAFLDLEKAAKHRGSSFGSWNDPQPSAATFENTLGLEISNLLARPEAESKQTVWLEDESKSIGRLVLPPKIFNAISNSQVWILERPRAARAQRLTFEYLTENYRLKDGTQPSIELAHRVELDIRRAITNIERRLGGLETQNVLGMASESAQEFALSGNFSAHWPWVERVLTTYYDPLYEKHLRLIADRVIGRGPEEAFLALASH